MPYTLIKGSFHIFYPSKPLTGPEPDGDTIKFLPDDRYLVERLTKNGRSAKFNKDGITTLRFEGIDALEMHYRAEGDNFHQRYDLAIQARDKLLSMAGFGNVKYFENKPFKVEKVENHPIQGYILSSGLDAYGRVIAFVFTGETDIIDGSIIHATPRDIEPSLNVLMLKEGHAYGEFYSTLPPELRMYMHDVVVVTRKSGKGLWLHDTVAVGKSAEIHRVEDMQNIVMWPKLFRRLVTFFQSGYMGLSNFDSWLRADPMSRDDPVLLPTIELGNIHDLIKIQGNKIELLYDPESVVIVPHNYELPTQEPATMSPVPMPKGVKIIAALIDPSDKRKGPQTVTLLNVCNEMVDLKGWYLADTTHKQELSGKIKRGDTFQVELANRYTSKCMRGNLTLIDNNETIVDQVAFEMKHMPAEGFTMVFEATAA